MAMKMNLKQNKIGKVMREFKKGELNIGQSSKKVKNPKQAIAIALSETGMSRKKMAVGGLANSVRTFSSASTTKEVDHSKFMVGWISFEQKSC